jgi:hypothetical protein
MTSFAIERADTRGAAPQSRVRDWLVLAPLLATTALFAAGNHNFGFDPPGWLDTFLYVGYFWHYPEHLPLFDEYYKVSRLPWVLPGFVVHSLFDPIAASYVLMWIVLASGGVIAYFLTKDAIDDRHVATVASVMYVSFTGSHGIGGWNYHVLAAANYYLLACWLVIRSGYASAPGRWSIAAGVAFAATVHTHLFFVLFAPLLGLLYVASRGAWQWKRFAADTGLLIAGGTGLTVLLMIINRATGGAWLFFMPQIQYTLAMSQGANAWFLSSHDWLPGATYLALPMLALIAAAIGTAFLPAGRTRRVGAAFAIQAWGVFVIYAVYQFFRQQSVLQPGYMAFGLSCLTAPSLAILLVTKRRSDDRVGFILAGVSVLLIVGTLLAGGPAVMVPVLRRLQMALGLTEEALATAGLFGAALLALVVLTPAKWRLLTGALWFAVMNAMLTTVVSSYGIGSPGIQRTMLGLFRQTDQATARLDPSLLGIKYWFVDEVVQTPQGAIDLADVFDSYVSTRGFQGNLLNGQMTAVPLEQLQPAHVQGAVCVGLLSSPERHDATRAAFVNAATAAGIPMTAVLERERYTGDGLAYTLSVYRVLADPAGNRPPCQPH